ncbi:GNAT-like putative antirestriction protein, partial [Chryseobacterium gambrini]
DKPVSMKYRGIFKLDAKKDGFLNYSSDVRSGSPDEIYQEWLKKYGK